MNIGIPKSNLKCISQMEITDEIRNLERQFIAHKQAAITNGWTYDNYREYIRIRKGRKVTHTNYMMDSQGRKYYTDREKCELLERPGEKYLK